MTDKWFDTLGIVRCGRWLAWGAGHGVMVRPDWLARAIVHSWNWLSCRALGHEWVPDIEVTPTGTTPDVRLTGEEFCPNCCATREGGA